MRGRPAMAPTRCRLEQGSCSGARLRRASIAMATWGHFVAVGQNTHPSSLAAPATSPPFTRHPWWGRLPLTRRAGSGGGRAELRWAGLATPEGTQRGRPGLRAQALDGGKAVPFILVSREKSRIGTELRDQGRERRRGPGLRAVAHTGLVSRGTRSAAVKGSCLLLRPQATAFLN